MFYKYGNEWKSLEDEITNKDLYPSTEHWFIAFDGKQIGNFHSKKEKLKFPKSTFTFPRDAYHSTIEKDLPTIGEPTKDFESWANEKEIRPLVVVSKPNYADPENWKPYNSSAEDLNLFFRYYNEYIETSCDGKSVNKSNMQFLKSYESNKQEKLIQIGEMRKMGNTEYINNRVWFYKSESGEIINLSHKIDYSFMQDDYRDDDHSRNTLVDAGDYDLDGKSELIFWSNRYNGDGYVMFYNDFAEKIDFDWSYH